MATGSPAYVTVTIQNTGTTTWYPGYSNPYRLGSQNPADNTIWGVGRVELGSTVPPGGQAVFGFYITAPSTPGTYSFSWGMLREGLFWFGSLASSTITVSAPPPVYDAQLVSASVPAQMTAGGAYSVSLTYKNTGNVTWTSDYLLGSTSPDDNFTWGLHRVNLPVGSVAPGQSVTFNYQVTAPSTAGTYLFDWGMLWEYHWRFGQTSRSYVTVNPVVTAPRPTISVSRPSLTAGQSFTTSWSTTDASSLTHVCTASGTGYTVNESLAVNGTRTLTAQSAWVGYPSTCTWTASGAGGSATYTETMTTVAAPPSAVVTYIHTDGLGSPVARTNASGAVISRTRYEPYGYVASGEQPTIGFTGHVNDVDTGLTYMQQRYYDPVAGRFLSIDPVVTDVDTGGSFNRYAYASNNPYNYIDPDGRRDIYIGGAADKNDTKIVQNYAGNQQKLNPGRDIQYFSYSEKKEISAAMNAPLKAGEPLNVIGHSLGGREAVNQANATGVQITNLITIDPVGSAGNGTKPANVGNWIDVTAVPNERNFSDTVASTGRIFMGTTATAGADSLQKLPASHGDFDKMMLNSGSQEKIDISY